MSVSRIARLLGTGLLAGVLSMPAAAQGYRVGDIELSNPWVRLPPPVSSTAAGYVVLRNHGAQPDRLLELRTDIAGRSEMHNSQMNDGVMTMQRVEAIDLPPAGELRFEPGGLHIMLMGLGAKLEDGASVPMTLRFEHAGELLVDFTVRRQ